MYWNTFLSVKRQWWKRERETTVYVHMWTVTDNLCTAEGGRGFSCALKTDASKRKFDKIKKGNHRYDSKRIKLFVVYHK